MKERERERRGRHLLEIARAISEQRQKLDALVVGDPTGIPNRLKHMLDDPIESIRAYARQLYMGETPSRLDRPGGGDYE